MLEATEGNCPKAHSVWKCSAFRLLPFGRAGTDSNQLHDTGIYTMIAKLGGCGKVVAQVRVAMRMKVFVWQQRCGKGGCVAGRDAAKKVWERVTGRETDRKERHRKRVKRDR
jgi:hypothetical protein